MTILVSIVAFSFAFGSVTSLSRSDADVLGVAKFSQEASVYSIGRAANDSSTLYTRKVKDGGSSLQFMSSLHRQR